MTVAESAFVNLYPGAMGTRPLAPDGMFSGNVTVDGDGSGSWCQLWFLSQSSSILYAITKLTLVTSGAVPDRNCWYRYFAGRFRDWELQLPGHKVSDVGDGVGVGYVEHDSRNHAYLQMNSLGDVSSLLAGIYIDNKNSCVYRLTIEGHYYHLVDWVNAGQPLAWGPY